MFTYFYEIGTFYYHFQSFNEVTILLSDIVGFTTICSQITPLEVVKLLNAMYSLFDSLSEKHKVYKVSVPEDHLTFGHLVIE